MATTRPSTAIPPTLKLSVQEYDRMVELGAFDDIAQKIELIYGELVAMNPAGPMHDDIISSLLHWSVNHSNDDEVVIRAQSGITLPQVQSRPEPDIAWVRAKPYRDSHPTANDVFLLIEVSQSSLTVDRSIKAGLYAEAGIPEYWIVDIEACKIHVHLAPSAQSYDSLRTYSASETLHPAKFPAAILELTKLFSS